MAQTTIVPLARKSSAMEQLPIDNEIAKLMPALYVVVTFIFVVFSSFVAVVWKLTRDNKESRETFLKFISDQNAAQRLAEHEKSEALKELGGNCHDFQRDLAGQTKGVFGEVTTALKQNTQALGANTNTLEQMAQIIEHRQHKTT